MGFEGLCLGPLYPGSTSDAPTWETTAAAYAQPLRRAAVAARDGRSGTILVATVSDDDKNWSTSPSEPNEQKWGTFPSVTPAQPELAQAPYAIAFDGARLRVVGSSASGAGLSLVFVEGAASPGGATLEASALEVAPVLAFYGLVVSSSGVAYATGPAADGTLAVVQLTPSNQLDPSFGQAAGVTRVSVATGAAKGAGIALDPGGAIVVAFSAGALGTTHLVRLTARGDRDTSFGHDGLLELPLLNPLDERLGIAVEADSAILVAGLAPEPDGAPTRGAIARILPTGRLDPDYGQNGIALAPALQPAPQGEQRAKPDRVRLSVVPGASRCKGRAFLFVVEADQSLGYAFLP